MVSKMGKGTLRLVTTPTASQLTGLSVEKLREWTSRRALVPADVRPKQKGSPAKFSWQTILTLRVAVFLRDRFGLELQSHKESFADLKKELLAKSFIELWGRRLVLSPGGTWSFIEELAPVPQGDMILLQLDPHLEVLRDGFSIPNVVTAPGQLDLFSLPGAHPADSKLRIRHNPDFCQQRSA